MHYWLHAVNRHSLHAPFVYHLYTQIINKNSKLPVFEEIEAYRKTYLQDHTFISVNSPGANSHWTHSKARKVSNIAKYGLSSAKFSQLLYRLVDQQKPNVIIELGSSLGINTLYLSAAHPDAIIYTFEGCPQTAALAKRLFNHWPLKNITLIEGDIDQTLHPLLSQVKTVDFAYLDANHRYEPTLRYYAMLFEKAHPHSVFVLDDIYWSSAMLRAWKHIKDQPEVSLSLDIFDAGLLFFKPMHYRQHHALMF